MQAYDQHQFLSSFFMLFHKYGIFISLLPIFTFAMNRLPWPPSTDSQTSLQNLLRTMHLQDHCWYRHTHVMTSCFIFLCTTIGFYLQRVVFDRSSKTDVTLSFLLSLGVAIALSISLELLYIFRRHTNLSIFSSKHKTTTV